MKEALQDDDEKVVKISTSAKVVVDHLAYVMQHTVSCLVYYIAGYVVKMIFLQSSCEPCKLLCFVNKNVPASLPAATCVEWDLGGLLYSIQGLVPTHSGAGEQTYMHIQPSKVPRKGG